MLKAHVFFGHLLPSVQKEAQVAPSASVGLWRNEKTWVRVRTGLPVATLVYVVHQHAEKMNVFDCVASTGINDLCGDTLCIRHRVSTAFTPSPLRRVGNLNQYRVVFVVHAATFNLHNQGSDHGKQSTPLSTCDSPAALHPVLAVI